MVHKEDEKHYYIIDDSGNEFGYYKKHFKDTEPTFTYGQGVEFLTTHLKYTFLCSDGNWAWIKFNNASPFTTELNNIRPIRSIREQIVEVLKPKLAFDNMEEIDSIADRILEITNPASN